MGRMAEQQRKLLEQMMGPEAMGMTMVQADWWDPKVCRNFLCGTCPHDVFGNTKMDLGPCPRLHSDKIVKAYNEAKAKNPLDPRFAAFEQEYQNNIRAFMDDCDRKIRASQRRLEKTPEENKRTVDLMKEVGEIELAIQGVTEEIEQLGEAGKVEESMAKLQAVEALKQEKEDKEGELQRLTETGGASGHQKLRVCETCGAYLSVLDSDRRLADHFGGKLHLGYHELRIKIDEFNQQRMAGRPALAPKPTGPLAAPPTNAPSGPSGRSVAPPPSAPSGPSAAATSAMGPPPPAGPSTPSRPSDRPTAMDIGFDDVKSDGGSSLAPSGHGDKRKRDVHELAEDTAAARSTRRREEDRERSSRYRERSRERDGGHRSSRHDNDDDYRRDKERRSRDDDRRRDRGDRDPRERERDSRDSRDRDDRRREERR